MHHLWVLICLQGVGGGGGGGGGVVVLCVCLCYVVGPATRQLAGFVGLWERDVAPW